MRTLSINFQMSLRIAGIAVILASILTGCSSTPNLEPSVSPTAQETEPTTIETEVAEETVKPETTSAPSQTVEYTISGGCLDSFEILGHYRIFEEYGDDCYLVVEVFPPEPSRLAELQYFETTWVTESSARTDSTGIVYLEVDPLCEDGLWCDGVWEYRVFLGEESGLPADRSLTFELDFLPYY